MKKHILSLDFIIVIITSVLMSAGYFILSSATADTKRLTIQAISVMLGRVLMIVCAFWDFKSVKENKNYIYLLALFLLLLVFPFGIGKEDKGALSWIRFGGIGFQPSEFAKLLFSLYISFELTDKIEQKTLNKPKELLLFLLKCGLLIGLVILQNDTGTALVFVFMLVVTLFVSGIDFKYIAIGCLIFLISLPLVWFFLSGYQKDRILVFFNPDSDLSDSGYQVYLSKLALSSGGIFGNGYKNGAVNALSYLPEKETDFIFPIIGEEFGLFGTLIILLLFFVFILKIRNIFVYIIF